MPLTGAWPSRVGVGRVGVCGRVCQTSAVRAVGDPGARNPRIMRTGSSARGRFMFLPYRQSGFSTLSHSRMLSTVDNRGRSRKSGETAPIQVAAGLLKAELKRRNVSYRNLADKLALIGIH